MGNTKPFLPRITRISRIIDDVLLSHMRSFLVQDMFASQENNICILFKAIRAIRVIRGKKGLVLPIDF